MAKRSEPTGEPIFLTVADRLWLVLFTMRVAEPNVHTVFNLEEFGPALVLEKRHDPTKHQ